MVPITKKYRTLGKYFVKILRIFVKTIKMRQRKKTSFLFAYILLHT